MTAYLILDDHKPQFVVAEGWKDALKEWRAYNGLEKTARPKEMWFWAGHVNCLYHVVNEPQYKISTTDYSR